MSSMTKAAWCILVSIALFCPLAVWIHCSVTVSSADRDRIARRFTFPEACLPEPGERLAFLAGVVCLPALIFGTNALARKFEPRWRLGVRAPASLMFETALGALLFLCCR